MTLKQEEVSGAGFLQNINKERDLVHVLLKHFIVYVNRIKSFVLLVCLSDL